MIQEIFCDLLPSPAPQRADVWEASRIAVDAALPASTRERALRSLIVGVQQYGLDNGIHHYLGLMSVPIFRRTLIRHGVAVNIHSD